MRLSRRLVASLLLLALGACGGGDLVLPNEGQPRRGRGRLRATAQTGTILEPLPDSLVVKVTDRFGNPVPGIEISWSADGGGEVRPATAVTGVGRAAATQRVLGAQPGSYGTTAVAPALPEDAVTFTTTAVAAKLVLDDPARPARILGRAARSTARSPSSRIPAGHRSPGTGVTVSVQIASGDGTPPRARPAAASDADGRVTFTDLAIAGTPGTRTLIFAADGYASAISTPVSLGVGAPASVAVAAGDGQTAPVGTAVPVLPAVVVRDAGGTPVPGMPVTFAVASGGGSLTGAAATTGADGIATVGGWTLGQRDRGQHAHGDRGRRRRDRQPGDLHRHRRCLAPPARRRARCQAAPRTIPASTGSTHSTVTIMVRDEPGNPTRWADR